MLASGKEAEVVEFAVVSTMVSGVVVEDVDHSIEYPAIPLAPPSAPDHSTSMVESLYHVLVDVWEELPRLSGF